MLSSKGEVLLSSSPKIYAIHDGDMIRFKGGVDGDHSISADGDLDRYMAHWTGYCNNSDVMHTPFTKNFRSLRHAIELERNDAQAEAKLHYRCVKSRGMFLTASRKGESIISSSDCLSLNKVTLSELKKDISWIIKTHPNVDSIGLEGGFDGSDHLKELLEGGNYSPWVSEWAFEIWRKSWNVEIPFI